MTGAARLIEALPHRNQNVFFAAYGLSCTKKLPKNHLEQRWVKIRKAAEDAIQSGGRHFICCNKDFLDTYFILLVTELRGRYPEITINICYKCKSKKKAAFSKNHEIYKGINRTVVLFPDTSIRTGPGYIESLVMASSQVIGYAPPYVEERGALFQYCKRHNVPFVNAFSLADIVDATRFAASGSFGIKATTARIMEGAVTSRAVRYLYQDWLIERGKMIGQLQKRGVPGKWLAELQSIDEEYLARMKDTCVKHGASHILDYVNYLSGCIDYLRNQIILLQGETD